MQMIRQWIRQIQFFNHKYLGDRGVSPQMAIGQIVGARAAIIEVENFPDPSNI